MALLALRGVTKSFTGVMAVKDLDLDVNEGEIVSIIGPNGAGKTTTFNLVSGFERPDAGTITFKGKSLVGLKPYQVCHKGIGRTFQIVRPFPSLTVWDNVVVAGLSKAKMSEARQGAIEILQLAGLWERSGQLATQLTLAGRKRLEIARALATQPHLLLLDEVFAGLNPVEIGETIELLQKLRERGISSVAGIEHVMKAVMSVSDRVVVLHHGEKIAEGPPADIVKDERVVNAYLGQRRA